MWSNISKLVVAVILVTFAVGCQSKNPSPSASDNEELRLLTPEQKKLLFDNAEKVERKEVVTQELKNDKGEVIGTLSSQTFVIFLKRGGKFNVNVTCSGSCTGVPLNICPGHSACGCNSDTAGNCFCGACQADSNCKGTCTGTSIGFGNFRLIAMDRNNSSETTVAQK